MKILLLTDCNSPHSRKWASALRGKGAEVGIFSIASPREDWFTVQGITCFVPVRFSEKIASSGLLSKLGYLRLHSFLKEILRSFRPDAIHAHYASSYGLLGALSGFHPFVISAWGSDIFFFSKIPLAGSLVLRFNFRRADRILSTSRSMIPVIRKFTRKEITVTPFGVDTGFFRPLPGKSIFQPGDFVIGTIKSLEPVYGIGYLLRSFAILKEKHPELPLKLLIVGGGSLNAQLKSLAHELGIGDLTVFTGKIGHEQLVPYFNALDIYAALSLSESFGVAVLEASACGIPVVVTRVGGLPEVVEEGTTGFIVPPADTVSTVEAFEKLLQDPSLRSGMGKAGREFVIKNYNVEDSVNKMMAVYRELLPGVVI